MIIEDNTLNKTFSDLPFGACFVMYSQYYMKLHIKYYDEYSNKTATYSKFAVNLETGIAECIKDDTKVRVVEGKMIIG